MTELSSRNIEQLHHHLLVCQGKNCRKAGAKSLYKALNKELDSRGLKKKIQTTKTKCLEQCKDKCVVIDYPEGTWYRKRSAADAGGLIDRIVEEGSSEDPDVVSYVLKEEGFKKKNKKKK